VERPPTWHERTIRQLRAILEKDPAVIICAIVGSGARSAWDTWSDLDVVIAVETEAFSRFFPTLDWLAPLGPMYAFEQHHAEPRAVSRICFDDLRRLDLIITTGDELARPEDWSALLAGGVRPLFSRDAAITRVLETPSEPPPPTPMADAFANLANGFWFKAVIAVQRVVRGDLLVALHLSLELVQECCVLAMMLRDRDTGTTQHRGGVGNDLVAELESTRQPYSATGILESIEQCAVLFDRLAHRWTADYEDRRGPLLTGIDSAKLGSP
jgi:predicted nucleotidyltransferase